MLAGARVHLHLHSFNVRTVLWVDAGNSCVQEYTAVTGRLALELEAQIEVAIGLLGGQVAVLVGRAFAQNGAPFNDPLLFSVLLPAGQIFAVEKSDPSALRRRLSCRGKPEQYQTYDKATNSFHGKASVSYIAGTKSVPFGGDSITNPRVKKQGSLSSCGVSATAPGRRKSRGTREATNLFMEGLRLLYSRE